MALYLRIQEISSGGKYSCRVLGPELPHYCVEKNTWFKADLMVMVQSSEYRVLTYVGGVKFPSKVCLSYYSQQPTPSVWSPVSVCPPSPGISSHQQQQHNSYNSSHIWLKISSVESVCSI